MLDISKLRLTQPSLAGSWAELGNSSAMFVVATPDILILWKCFNPIIIRVRERGSLRPGLLGPLFNTLGVKIE